MRSVTALNSKIDVCFPQSLEITVKLFSACAPSCLTKDVTVQNPGCKQATNFHQVRFHNKSPFDECNKSRGSFGGFGEDEQAIYLLIESMHAFQTAKPMKVPQHELPTIPSIGPTGVRGHIRRFKNNY